jgi:hypothetical protein
MERTLYVVPALTAGVETTLRGIFLSRKKTSYVVPPPTVGAETTSGGLLFSFHKSKPREWYHHQQTVLTPGCLIHVGP